MEATAKLRYLRMSARKVRLVADLIRGKNVGVALETLKFMDKKAAKHMSLLLQSAAANAGNTEGMDTETLYISTLTVDEGPMWKRFMPRSRGMAYPILKKTSHINITLKDRPRPVAETNTPEKSAAETKPAEPKAEAKVETPAAEAPKKRGRKKAEPKAE